MGQLAEEAGPQGGLSGPRQGPKCLLIKSQLGLEPALSLPSPGTLHTPLSEVTSWEAAQGDEWGGVRQGDGEGGLRQRKTGRHSGPHKRRPGVSSGEDERIPLPNNKGHEECPVRPP